MELGCDGGAGDGENVAVGIAGCFPSRGIGVVNGHSSPIRAVGRGSGVAELIDTRLDTTKGVVARARRGEANLSRKVGLPYSNLTAESIILVASRKPRDICHVERDQARRGDHAPFVVVIPGGGRAIGLGLGNLVTAVPRRGRDLTGEILQRRALAFCVVCHVVSGDSIPHSINVRLGAGFGYFATRIGGRDVARGFAGDERGRLLMEVGNGFNPKV